jgi:diguanylate cyclase (GGDEF)-like protein
MYIDLPQRQLAISVSAEQLHFDPVLGVPDRFGLGNIIEQVLQQATQRHFTAGYFVIGIDRMKMIGQAFGPGIAHEVLSVAAQTLVRYCADRAHVCWLGGDMFAVVMMHVAPEEIGRRATEMQNLFRDPGHAWPKGVHVTVSIGGVAMPQSAATAHDVMNAGENALYEAKQSGRNCHVVYTPVAADKNDLREAMLIANQVQRALHENAVHLAYQPVVCSKTGQVLFYEALARLFDERGQPIPAAHFIPAVEQMGLAYQLDCRVLVMAVTELKAHPTLQLAVNISGSTAEHPEWSAYLAAAMDDRRDLASRLIIEITESVQMRDINVTRRFVDFARNLGGRVALDDFGAGYTTMQQLTGLNVQVMKIDRAMVTGLGGNVQQQTVVRAMIALARSLGLKIVAEGVEDVTVANWLTEEKVEMQQGFHHGHPAFDKPWRKAAA